MPRFQWVSPEHRVDVYSYGECYDSFQCRGFSNQPVSHAVVAALINDYRNGLHGRVV